MSDSNEAVFTELAMSVDCERDKEKQEEERVLAWVRRKGECVCVLSFFVFLL